MAVYRGQNEVASGQPSHDGKEVTKVHYWTKARWDEQLAITVAGTQDDDDVDSGVRNDCYYFVSDEADA